jgi:hypothetical protein
VYVENSADQSKQSVGPSVGQNNNWKLKKQIRGSHSRSTPLHTETQPHQPTNKHKKRQRRPLRTPVKSSMTSAFLGSGSARGTSPLLPARCDVMRSTMVLWNTTRLAR